MSFGDRLKEARRRKGYTQTQLAKKIGVAGPTITGYEKNNSEPNMLTISKIIEVLGVDANFLLQDKPNQVNFENTATPEEFEALIKKYRSLDDHGKETVRMILDRESERTKIVQQQAERIAELETKANNIPDMEMHPYPYLRRIACAGTAFTFDDIPTEQKLVPYMPGADFIIGVNGNSMEPDYYDGELLYVRKTDRLDYGDIGIFTMGNEWYVKECGESGLISHNPDYDDIPGNEDIRIVGEVIGKVPESYV